MKLSIIIPVYHEEKNIGKVLDRIKKSVRTSHEILVLYGNSDDPTLKVLNSYLKSQKKGNILAIQNAAKDGRRIISSIKTGLKKAKGRAVVFTMADLSDDVSQVDQMFQLIKDGSDIVCASRYMKDGKKIGGPVIKTILSKLAGLTLYYFFKVPTHDSTNAFKMYKREIFSKINIKSTGGFEYSLEIVLKAHKKGYKITEIPTVWRDREAGKSNFKFLSWLPKYFKTYFYVFGKN